MFTPRAIRINVKNIPNIPKSVIGAAKFPSVTIVASLETTIPTDFNPINAMKNPTPALTAYFNEFGIAFIIFSLNPVPAIIINNNPEINIANNPCCHV